MTSLLFDTNVQQKDESNKQHLTANVKSENTHDNGMYHEPTAGLDLFALMHPYNSISFCLVELNQVKPETSHM